MPRKADARLFEINRIQAAVLVGVACLGIGIVGISFLTHEALLLRRSYDIERYRQRARAIFENSTAPSYSSRSAVDYSKATAELAIDGGYFLLLIYTGCRCLYKRGLPRWELITSLITSFIMARNPFFPMSWGHFFVAALFAAVVIADSRLNQDKSPQPETDSDPATSEAMHGNEPGSSQN